MGDKMHARSILRSPFDFDRHSRDREIECVYFNSFRYFEPDARIGPFTRAESPDFRIAADNRVIGVEITRLFKPEGRQDIESSQDRILEAACHGAQTRCLPPAYVTLFFNLCVPLDGAARGRIADAGVGVVAEHMPPEGESVELDMRPGQPPEVDLIIVNRVHCHAPGRWEWFESGAIERNVTCLIQAAITEKTAKLCAYLECCTECWLLLVADSFRASGNSAFENNHRAHLFASPFGRTYVLDFGRGKLHRLSTASQSP
jgi:hypothetical protein